MAARATIRIPMPVKMRAKQFMMFDAMKGLTEAIAEKERQYYPQKELTSDRTDEINNKLILLQKGDLITVSYYCLHAKAYCIIEGYFQGVDHFEKKITVNKTIISICNVYEIVNHREQNNRCDPF